MGCYNGPCMLPGLCLCFIQPLLQLLLQLAGCRGQQGMVAVQSGAAAAASWDQAEGLGGTMAS